MLALVSIAANLPAKKKTHTKTGRHLSETAPKNKSNDSVNHYPLAVDI